MGSAPFFVALAVGLLGLVFAVISLGFHWIRRAEHPDVTKLRTDMLDLIDKTEHWIRRDRVRKLRASREESAEPDSDATPVQPASNNPADIKAALRRRVYGARTQ